MGYEYYDKLASIRYDHISFSYHYFSRDISPQDNFEKIKEKKHLPPHLFSKNIVTDMYKTMTRLCEISLSYRTHSITRISKSFLDIKKSFHSYHHNICNN